MTKSNFARLGQRIIVFVITALILITGAPYLATTPRLLADNSSIIYLPLAIRGPQPCPDWYHDPNEWHPLVDPVTGCHYAHEHKHDPNQINDIFGPPGAWFSGTAISYPWETPHENHLKHEAYSWIVRRNIPSHNRTIWIKDFRLQIHATSAPFTAENGSLHGGYLARFHSYSLEAQVCDLLGNCGIVRTGGWVDFGNLEIDGYGAVPLPGEEDAVSDLGRRRIHYNHPDFELRWQPQFGASFFWYGRQRPPQPPWTNVPLHPVLIAVSTKDSSVNVDPDRLDELLFFCPEFNCNKNDSTIQAHVVQISVPGGPYADTNGIVNLNTFTNRYGELVTSCAVPALDCVPLIIDNAPASGGTLQHRDDTHLIDHPNTGYDDFDTSPSGHWWIKYPN